MIVDTKTPYRSIFQGETYYFCSENCRQAFEANPAHYAARAHGAADTKPADQPLERHEPRFTKTRDGLVSPKFGSAGSGGAEYELLPEAHDDDEKR
jgi:YHS domain-containing protein